MKYLKAYYLFNYSQCLLFQNIFIDVFVRNVIKIATALQQ